MCVSITAHYNRNETGVDLESPWPHEHHTWRLNRTAYGKMGVVTTTTGTADLTRFTRHVGTGGHKQFVHGVSMMCVTVHHQCLHKMCTITTQARATPGRVVMCGPVGIHITRQHTRYGTKIAYRGAVTCVYI